MSETIIQTLYGLIIDEVEVAWEKLKKHRHQMTADINEASINSFSKSASQNLKSIKERLIARNYVFTEMRPVKINQKGKSRTILISAIEDRIVCKAILTVINPLFKSYNSNHDYSREIIGLRSGGLKGVPLAALAVQKYLKEGFNWVLEADIKKFFENVPKDKILEIVAKEIKDTELFGLIKNIVEYKVAIEGGSEDDRFPYKGIAQGSSISPLLASIYLYQFDEYIKLEKDVRLVRYVDDFIILCKDSETADRLHILSRDKLKGMGLDIHEKDKADEKGNIKTRIVNSKQESFNFLGLSFNYLDIDIAGSKKKDLISGVQEILHKNRGHFYAKIKKIENKLKGFIRQYRHPHYTRTKQSLIALVKEAHKEIEADYVNEFKGILGKSFFNKLTKQQQEKFLFILGIEINKLVK